jgi:hypothetical protein
MRLFRVPAWGRGGNVAILAWFVRDRLAIIGRPRQIATDFA